MIVRLLETFMSIRKSGMALLLAGLGLALAPTVASAQDLGGPFPTLQGNDGRTGQNRDPFHFNSGQTILEWFYPYGNPATNATLNAATTPTIIDDYTWNGRPAGSVSANVPWAMPLDYTKEASDPFTYPESPYPVPNGTSNQFGVYNSYHYHTCVPATEGGSPNSGATAWFVWTFNQLSLAGSYGVYVWLPFGPTDTAQSDGANDIQYPEEFFVYRINYGNGQSYTDVVDTYQSGGGWVRLGNGGLPTNVTFPYDGVHPITVTLFNTIPYNGSGNLSTGTVQTANQYLVYADACEAQFVSGTYTAAPTSDYWRDANGNPRLDNANGDKDVGSDYLFNAFWGRISAAENVYNSGVVNGLAQTQMNGVVREFQMNSGEWKTPPTTTGLTANGQPTVLWQYSPSVSSPYLGTTVTQGAPTAGWNTDTNNTHYQGTSYYSTAISTTAATQTVTYKPVLTTGGYTIYAYIPGNGGGELYGTSIEYTISQGAKVVYTGTLDESGLSQSGWVQLGGGTFENVATGSGAAPLTVQLSNYDTVTTDPPTSLAYANAVRFVGAANLAINSSPVHAMAYVTPQGGGAPVYTQIVIVADESGRIHCLDETGNADGTTTEYWSYPSTANPNNPNWIDPNLADGSDGPPNATVPSAIMPIAFNTSTAVVQTINGNSYLWIASSNGRVYCISMAGRGDYVASTGVIGSTKRVWTYPNDYPSQTVPSNLGPIQGSLAFAGTADGVAKPTIYVPAYNGRIIALDAVGNTTGKTTTVDWAYPALNSPSLPPIVMNPMVGFGNLYFGTEMVQSTQAPGTFYALNLSTGNPVWSFNGTGGANQVPAGNFLCSPTMASKAVLQQETGANYTITPQDSVYVLSDNEFVYGLNAETGALLTDTTGQLTYQTDELFTNSYTGLGFTFLYTYDRTALNNTLATPRLIPTVLVPTSDGHVYGLAANVDDYNGFTQIPGPAYLTDFQINTTGTNVTPVVNSNGRLIFGDDAGFLDVYDNDLYGAQITAGQPPSSTSQAPDQPGPADAFRYPHVMLLKQSGYTALRNVAANTNQTTISEQDATTKYNYPIPPNAPVGPNKIQEAAFEWGQTAYILVYGFPYANQYSPTNGGAPTRIQEPQVNIKISVNGKVIRDFQVDSHLFLNPGNAPALYQPNPAFDNWPNWESAPGTGTTQDAYAILAYTFQGGGANALPPGPGTISADITTAAVSTNGTTPQEIMADPAPTNGQPTGAALPFIMDNPLGIQVTDTYTTGSPIYHSIGATYQPYDADAMVQGTPFIPNLPTNYDQSTDPITNQTVRFDTNGAESQLNQLTATTPWGIDGQTSVGNVFLYDRSLMTLIRPPGVGLGNVRIDHGDLAWQGGENTIYRPMYGLYPNFEDTPVNYPNTSLDYPNLSRDDITFALNPNGNAQNPALTGVTLNPPTLPQNYDPSTNPARQLNPTPLNINVNVPLFQPGVDYTKLQKNTGVSGSNDPLNFLQIKNDSNGQPVTTQGYYGDMNVYVDSTGSGIFNDQDSYRHFNFTTDVAPSFRINVTTPSVDLGSLPNGANYSPVNPRQQSRTVGPASPWSGIWNSSYQPFTVVNEGNTNVLDIRLAKATTIGGESPWSFLGNENDPLAWLDGTLDLYSNIDTTFAPLNSKTSTGDGVFAQKPRVTDTVGSTLVVNPTPRANPNITNQSLAPLNASGNYPSSSPKVTVSLPFGFPSGNYSSTLRVIDDTPFSILNSNTLVDSSPINGIEQTWEPISLDGNGNATSYEPASDPGFTVSFKARETRLTNTSTPGTVPGLDNFLLPGSTYAYTNNLPAAMRDAFGSVFVAWSSNRPTAAPANAGTLQTPPSTDTGKIYITSIANKGSFSGSSLTVPGNDPVLTNQAPQSPFRDLDFFTGNGANGTWLTSLTPNGYPSSSQFTTDKYGAPISGTEMYNAPAFPQDGEFDLMDTVNGSGNTVMFNGTYMAYIGSVQKSNTAGRVSDQRVFVTQVTTSEGGVFKATLPSQNLNEDALTGKGRPSVVQTTTGAFVFYPVTSSGVSTIHSNRVVGSTFAPAYVPLNFGSGFQSVTSPSAMIRPIYSGQNNAAPIIELSFSGKLRGESHSDIYLANLMVGKPANDSGNYHLVDANDVDAETSAAGSPFAFFPQQVNEPLVLRHGLYEVRGVDWDRQSPIQLVEYVNGAPANLLVAGSQNFDRETGLISYDTTLGGKVFFDPDLGTVRFTTGAPPRDSVLTLTYTPAFLRISSGGTAAYTEPTGLFEDHFNSNNNEWFNNGSQIAAGTVRDARFMFFFDRAAGGGVTARPFRTTMRFGINLPTRIYVDSNGIPETGNNTSTLTISGNVGPYQLDPSNGRIYFTPLDENRSITVTYLGQDVQGTTVKESMMANVGLVTEQSEQPVLIDQPVDETNLFAFLDPFTYPGAQNVRPPLVWMFYASTRAGMQDIYMQTIAPNLSPVTP